MSTSFVETLHQRVEDARRQRRRIPFIPTDSADDCGLACLAMVLGLHGHHAGVEELRAEAGAMDGGANLAQIATLARRRGLVPAGYQVDLDELTQLPIGTVLHWNMDHFVVLGRSGRRGMEIFDPATGPRWFGLDEIGDAFTGIVLTLEPATDFVRAAEGSEPLAPYIQMVLAHRGLLVGAIQASVLLHLLGFAVPIAFALVVEEVIPWTRSDALVLMSLALGVTALGQGLTHLIRGRVLALLSIRTETSMQGQYFHRLLHLSDEVLAVHTSGDLLQRSFSLHDLRNRVSNLFLSTLLDLFAALFVFISLLVIAPRIAMWLGLLGLAKAVWAAIMRDRREQLMATYLRAEGEMYGQQVEMVGMLESIKSMGREEASLTRWSAAFSDKCRAELEHDNLRALLASIHSGSATLVPMIVVAVAGAAVMRGELSLGSLFAISALAPGFMGPLSNMIGAVEELAGARSVARRINQILGAEPEEAPDKQARSIRLRGGVSLEDVEFRYSEDRLIIDGLDLDIEPGSMVAVVGPTGSGKSTLVKLLTGLRKPARGTVRFDGHDLQGLSLVTTRRQIGLVPQRVQLLRGSIRDNIAFGLDLDDEEIERAAKIARLHDRIVEDPYGYAAPLAEGGSSLSGGEAQRLAIARAIVSRPRLLILDEATSALDAATEVEVHEQLARLDCTKIVIAHRLSTIRSADRIVVMDRGRMIETGSHAMLMKKRGFYASLVAAQSREEVAA